MPTSISTCIYLYLYQLDSYTCIYIYIYVYMYLYIGTCIDMYIRLSLCFHRGLVSGLPQNPQVLNFLI